MVAGYCTFSDSAVVSLKSSPWLKYTQLGTIFQKNRVALSKVFFLLKYVVFRTVLSKQLKKNWGSLCSFKRKREYISQEKKTNGGYKHHL